MYLDKFQIESVTEKKYDTEARSMSMSGSFSKPYKVREHIYTLYSTDGKTYHIMHSRKPIRLVKGQIIRAFVSERSSDQATEYDIKYHCLYGLILTPHQFAKAISDYINRAKKIIKGANEEIERLTKIAE